LLADLAQKLNYYVEYNLDETYEALKELEDIIPFSKYIYTYELYKYRYYLFKGNLAEAENQRTLLDKQKKNFSQHEGYLFRFYNAVCLIKRGQYQAADDIFENLYADSNNENGNGDFLYHRAIVKGVLNQTGHAIHFGKMALHAFKDQHNFIRILHTLMLLGINYTDSNIYEEAEVCYQHLIRNAELLREEKMLPQIYHNMGFLQNKKNNRKEALIYFEKSLALQSPDHPNYLVTLYCIAEIYFLLDSPGEAKERFQAVQMLAKEKGSKKYKLLTDFYLMYLSSQEKALKFLELRVVPYFHETKQHYEGLGRFYKMLSDYYGSKGNYLEAFNYLNKIHKGGIK
jgi:tetratricopeptide (TPR) repeat protein